ncbi:MAG TPA: flavodoxin family protein [Candidatus Brocadiia bacterium]|nr:flavodoxin family protein [Candidatus Brocadiia bacterium]
MRAFPPCEFIGMANIVAFNGSPRRGGNTELLLQAALRGAGQAGATAQVFRLNDLSIRPCQNCGACEKTGRCVLPEDGMKAIYEALDQADFFVAATPIYFATISAQMKLMMDRCQPLWARKYLLKQPHPRAASRKGLALGVGGFKHRNFWPCAEKALNVWFTCLDIKRLGGLFCHAKALLEAEEAGRRLMRGEGPAPDAEGAQP